MPRQSCDLHLPALQALSGPFLAKTVAKSQAGLSISTPLTFDPQSRLLKGQPEALQYHCIAGAVYADLLIQNPEQACRVLSISSSWSGVLG